MKRKITLVLTAVAASLYMASCLHAQQVELPSSWKWLDKDRISFSYSASPDKSHVLDIATGKTSANVNSKKEAKHLPFVPENSDNPTLSPDSTKIAFTRDNDLWVADVASRQETRLTFDGSETILNGYSSWVYYEEILGRPTRYRAFWWSPDSKKIGFYRFDNEDVPVFPIYSSFPEDHDRSGIGLSYTQKAGAAIPLEGVSPTGGSVRMTRYPKCGDANPLVSIGMADLAGGGIVWADFDEKDDQYFGTPFWGADSKAFFIQREPRSQNKLDLYAVSPVDGSKTHIYHEEYKTWLDWIDGMIFGRDGLYMVRSFETSWQQIYYLSYDGKILSRLTDGPNWRVSLLDVDEGKPSKKFDGGQARVLFSAERDSRVCKGIYSAFKGEVQTVSNPSLHASRIAVAPDHKHIAASLDNGRTPTQVWILDVVNPSKSKIVADSADPLSDCSSMSLPQLITMTTKDGLELPALIVFPKGFDQTKKYPVHVDIYGGPDTPMVVDYWRGEHPYSWYVENEIIEVIADCRAAGHNGRLGLDQIYRRLSEREVMDFVEWADYLKTLPYVDPDKIGVEGFSFGGTMTALLVMDHPDAYHYGIAGGGVYDWALYDTHYTERFMDTPDSNPEGYAATRTVDHAVNYVVKHGSDDGSVMLKLTHGTGDDNVHFQNTLVLVDALTKAGGKFELMIYPDGMHGYRGYQGEHFNAANKEFWLKYLKR